MREHILFLMTDRYKYQTNTNTRQIQGCVNGWKRTQEAWKTPPPIKSCVAMVALFFLDLSNFIHFYVLSLSGNKRFMLWGDAGILSIEL